MKSRSLMAPWFCLFAAVNAPLAFSDTALDAYRQGHYAKAAEQWGTESNRDPVVSYYMGRMRWYGYGELRNTLSALHYFQQSAEKGFLPAQRMMALYSLLKDNNPEKALYWFKKASDANDVSAQMYCAAAYLFGVGTRKDTEAARRYYILAAKNGNAMAQYALALNFLESRQAASKQLGLLWLNKAVAQNNAAAQLKLGELYATGTLVEKDLIKAKELVGLSLAQGYAPALYQMGVFAQSENDFEKAKEWYSKAAMAHDAMGDFGLAQLYLQDKSPLLNPHLGFLAMLKAAQNGSKPARLALVDLYKKGVGVEADENLAKEWQKKAGESVKEEPRVALAHAARWLSVGKSDKLAASGYQLKGIATDWTNPEALKEQNYNQAPQMDSLDKTALYKPNFTLINPNAIPISDYYDALAGVLGSGGDKTALVFPKYVLDASANADDAKLKSLTGAARLAYLQGRAVLGDSTAQFTLGQMYQDGADVPKDVAMAISYYEKASAQQDLRAQYQLGMLYLEGKDVPADYQKALTNLQDAAFKGNDYAQYVLARTNELGYRNAAGEFVIKPDIEQATAMYELAAANEYGPAEYRLAELLVHEKQDDVLVRAARHRMIKKLYQKAFASGVSDAALPLAYFNAMDANKAKQSEAFAVAEKEAKEGHPQAALLLGLMYDRGIAVDASSSSAIHWYEKAGINPVSAFILGTYYSLGQGVSEDAEKGKSLLQQSAAAGFSYAHLNLAVMKQKSHEDFLPELNQAQALGNSTAGLLLADYDMSQASDVQKMKEAHDIYQHFAEKGDRDAQLKLGFMLQNGLGGPVDIGGAGKWYDSAARQNQFVAQYLLGHLYQLGQLGGTPDDVLAKQWYEHAARAYAPAAVALGFIYDTDEDNYRQAEAAYQLALAEHDPVAQLNLGLIYEKGKGQPVDFAKARTFYQASAEQGNAHAMVSLAGLFFNGQGGSRDDDLALSWYQKAAQLGDRDALYQLGLLAETGVSVPLDFNQAVHYYQQAADKDHVKAMLALARIYQYGLGVSKDNEKAMAYYKKTAAIGNPYAQYQLAIMYYNGVDGKRVPQLGKQWLQQAEQNGSVQASRALQWLDAQSASLGSFIEPLALAQAPVAGQPADRMYWDALNAWNCGDALSSKVILDKLRVEFPGYAPAKRAYDELTQQVNLTGILG